MVTDLNCDICHKIETGELAVVAAKIARYTDNSMGSKEDLIRLGILAFAHNYSEWKGGRQWNG